MQSTTLKEVDIATITAALTAAYDGYYIPLNFNDAAVETYLRVHDIVLEASPIWLEDGKPIAVGVLGVRAERGWVGAFGISPVYRGKGLAQAMFGELVRLAKQQRVRQVTLEVLEENLRAQAIYERAGFKATRKLFSLESAALPATREEAQNVDPAMFYSDEDPAQPAPCWQRERRTLELRAGQFSAVQSGKSFAVYRADGEQASIWRTRLNGGGDAVLATVARLSGAQSLSVTNEPEGSTLLVELYDRGWSPTAVQYEMHLNLSA